MMKTIWMKELTRGIVGLFLLIPASYFLFTLFVRIAFGSTSLYYAVAPSLLDQTFAVFSQAAWILYGPLLALFLNLPAWIKWQKEPNSGRPKLKFWSDSHWLNNIISFQSLLLLFMVTLYLIIEHFRYSHSG